MLKDFVLCPLTKTYGRLWHTDKCINELMLYFNKETSLIVHLNCISLSLSLSLSLTHSLSHTHTHARARRMTWEIEDRCGRTISDNLTRPIKIIRLEVLTTELWWLRHNKTLPSYSNFPLPPQACITGKPSKCEEEKRSKSQWERVPVPAVITLHVSNVSYDVIIL